MQLRQSAISYKPASISDYRKRRDFRELGGMPGFSIAKRSSVRLITLSEFNFPDVETRLKWEQYYSYLNRRYGLGLEAQYATGDPTDGELWMTVDEIEAAKADIQHRIYSGDSPSSRYVPKLIRAHNDSYVADDDEDEVVDDDHSVADDDHLVSDDDHSVADDVD